VKADGRNKQRRTYLVNLECIASALRRPPALLLAFISTPLGTSGQCDTASGTPQWFLKGHHERGVLQKSIMDLCSQLVVCPKCGDCGTRLYTVTTGVKKRSESSIRIKCDACGANKKTAFQDKKVAKSIPEAPPAKEKPTEESKPRKSKKKKKEKEEESDDDEWYTDASLEAVEARREAELARVGAASAVLIRAPTSLPTVKEAISEADDANEAVAPKETTKARPEQDRSGSEELLGSLLEALSKSKKANVGAAVEQWVAALGESRT